MRHPPAQPAALASGVASGLVSVPPRAASGRTPSAAVGACADPGSTRTGIVVLPAHTLQALRSPARVRALKGTLWLTVDGLAEDIVLEAGDSRCFVDGGRVLAHALGGPAVFEVCEPPPAAVRGGPGPVRMLLSGLARRLRRPRPVLGAGA